MGGPAIAKKDFLAIAEEAERLMLRGEFWSSSASRLLSSRQRFHDFLERFLQLAYGAPALIFNSGYHANMGAIGALNIPSTHFLIDRLMHASAYDALAACRADFSRFPHNDPEAVRKLISKALDKGAKQVVVITESIFSMGGDLGPLKQLTELKKDFPEMLLYVDEAHGFGVRGHHGLGLSEEMNIVPEVDILVGTFGKAAASAGAFVIARGCLKDIMVNRARSFIFSTALPPANIWVSLVNCLRLYVAEEDRERLRSMLTTPSQIVPLHAGSAERAVGIASALRKQGILALPIRRPTVPPGQEMVRLSFHSSLSMENLLKISEVLKEMGAEGILNLRKF